MYPAPPFSGETGRRLQPPAITPVAIARCRRGTWLLSAPCPNDPLASAIHTKVESSLIMRLSRENTPQMAWKPEPFGWRSHQVLPQVIYSVR